MKTVLIAAMAENRVIGKDNAMPWRLSGDLKRFKAITMGKPLIMGRKTWESIGAKPLPGRANIVVSRNRAFLAPGARVASTLDEAFELARQAIEDLAPDGDGEPEIMIMGGGQLYEETLPLADRLILTIVHASPEGDAWFPEFDLSQWMETAREHCKPGENDTASYSYVTLDRVV